MPWIYYQTDLLKYMQNWRKILSRIGKRAKREQKEIFSPFARAIFDLIFEEKDLGIILNEKYTIPFILSEISDVLIRFYRGVPQNNNENAFRLFVKSFGIKKS